MKKKVLLSLLIGSLALSFTGCMKTETITYTDENGNQVTKTETKDKLGLITFSEYNTAESNSPDEDIQEEAVIEEDVTDDILPMDEREYVTLSSDDGYTVTYDSEYFTYDTDGEYEGHDSIYIRCTVDKDNEYENYIDVSVAKDYDAKELIEGIAFQNETEVVPMHIVFANNKEYDAYYCTKYITDTFLMSFYAFDGPEAPYVIEIGSHIYDDDDEYAYYVSGIMEETFLNLEFADAE